MKINENQTKSMIFMNYGEFRIITSTAIIYSSTSSSSSSSSLAYKRLPMRILCFGGLLDFKNAHNSLPYCMVGSANVMRNLCLNKRLRMRILCLGGVLGNTKNIKTNAHNPSILHTRERSGDTHPLFKWAITKAYSMFLRLIGKREEIKQYT